jgi:hypothetical protein
MWDGARSEIVGANVVEDYIWYCLATGDGLVDGVMSVRSFASSNTLAS